MAQMESRNTCTPITMARDFVVTFSIDDARFFAGVCREDTTLGQRVPRANRTATLIQSGTLWVNEYIAIASKMPRGGYKRLISRTTEYIGSEPEGNLYRSPAISTHWEQAISNHVPLLSHPPDAHRRASLPLGRFSPEVWPAREGTSALRGIHSSRPVKTLP